MDIDDYTAKYTQQYQGAGWFEQVLVAARRRKVLESLAGHAHRSVLEIGCGLEPLFLHAPLVERFTVVEPSPEFVAGARASVPTGTRVEVLEGFLEDLEAQVAKHRPFDFIVLSSLLHEVSDAARLLLAVRRLCDGETLVHVNVPNVYSFHRLLALEMGTIADLFEPSATEQKFQRHTRFDRRSFTASLGAAGFEVERFGTYFVKPFTHAQMEILFDSGTLERRALEGLERMTKYLPEMGCEMFAEARRRDA